MSCKFVKRNRNEIGLISKLEVSSLRMILLYIYNNYINNYINNILFYNIILYYYIINIIIY